MMLGNFWHKKEKPFQGFGGFGGGATGLAGAGGANNMEATGGTTNEPGNGYKYHLFDYPNSDNFVVDKVGAPGEIEVLVVGGGGGGGNGGGAGGGGGGAGGVRNFTIALSAAGTYPISVGAGGDALAYDGAKAPGQGGDSAFNSPGGNSITKVVGSGGGAAGTYGQWGAGDLKGGIAGGSGGGQGSYPGGHSTPQAGSVASPDGRSPTTQGNAGGYTNPPGNANAGSGGGGAGGAGQNAYEPDDTAGSGGAGSPFPAFAYPLAFPAPMLPAFATPTNPLSGYVASPTSDHYGGGGGGSSGQPPQATDFVDGGTGGGGGGYNRYGPVPGNGPAKSGVDGLGGGGGGTAAGNAANTGAGGNGVVIIRYALL